MGWLLDHFIIWSMQFDTILQSNMQNIEWFFDLQTY